MFVASVPTRMRLMFVHTHSTAETFVLPQGNCRKPFPSSIDLGVQPFKPALPEQTPEQCMILLDGSGFSSTSAGAPLNDVHFSHSGIVCPKNVTACAPDEFKAEYNYSVDTYPLLVEKVLFHSLNPLTSESLRMQRNVVFTNVTLAGLAGTKKAPVFAAATRAVHMEGAVLFPQDAFR